MLDLIILIDYRKQFYSSRKTSHFGMDVPNIVASFLSHGIASRVLQYAEIDLRKDNYQGVPILYQSAQDPDLRYKSFIEDILLGLSLRGAVLVPDFPKFRAHHNKVFMEILRDCTKYSGVQSLYSQVFGTFEEYKLFAKSIGECVVIKPSEGAQSQGVRMVEDRKKQYKYVWRLSSSFSLCNFRWIIRNILFGDKYVRMSMNRKKFIIQEYVSDLPKDYKVVIYDTKYFVVERMNRRRDFRASGGGLLSFPIELPTGLLDFAETCFLAFNVPFASFDIGIKASEFFLFEFQFVNFGQYAVEMAGFCFERIPTEHLWKIVYGHFEAEKELAVAVVNYLKKNPPDAWNLRKCSL
jgi:glutathione synthase/RimK-type ligase-like ATP-grasp enzyme